MGDVAKAKAKAKLESAVQEVKQRLGQAERVGRRVNRQLIRLKTAKPVFESQAQKDAVIERAKLSEAVYDPAVKRVGKWVRVGDAITPETRGDECPPGFKAAIFRRGKEDRYILVIAGTDPEIADIINDVKQARGKAAAQYKFAVTLGLELQQKYKNLEVAGHSMGGGMGATISIVTGLPATVFNPAGVHKKTLKPYKKKVSDAHGLTVFVVAGEWLSTLQDSVLTILGWYLPNTPGGDNVNYIQYPGWLDPFQLHKMENVLKALDSAHVKKR